jgi:6-pyruvoyltetrahydropterin/6-carboxytetrahydropterin synthase
LHDQLDHHYINEVPGLEQGSLGDVAAWIKQHLRPSLPCLKDVRVSVAGGNAFRIVRLEADAVHDLPARLGFAFEAAQSLPHLEATHPCSRMHGHTYRIEVAAGDLDRLYEPLRLLYDELDHRCLNDIAELREATSERLCGWIWRKLEDRVDDLSAVVVQETATARCIYRGA